MKTKSFILLLLVSIMYSCTRGDELSNQNAFNKYEVVTLDSCEYIQYGSSYGYLEVTHKGDCKYCIERNKCKCK